MHILTDQEGRKIYESEMNKCKDLERGNILNHSRYAHFLLATWPLQKFELISYSYWCPGLDEEKQQGVLEYIYGKAYQ